MKRSFFNIGYLVFIIVCLAVWIFSVIQEYRTKKCQDEYGLSSNESRKKLGIPIIPNTWHIKERSEDFIWWTGDERVIGHKRKSVMFSGCDLYGELDVYNLPVKEGKQRLLEIEYRHRNKNHPDSVFYTYQVENTAFKISSSASDSILSAEHLRKDY